MRKNRYRNSRSLVGNSTGRSNRSKHNQTMDGGPTAKIPRNINIYRHVMESTNDAQVNWIHHLRHPDNKLREKIKRIPNQSFSVGERDIKCQQQGKKRLIDFTIRENAADVSFLLNKRMGKPATQAQGYFETGLRQYNFFGSNNYYCLFL